MKTLGFLLLLIYIHAAISSQVCVDNHISSNSFYTFQLFLKVVHCLCRSFSFQNNYSYCTVKYAILLTIISNTLTLLYVNESAESRSQVQKNLGLVHQIIISTNLVLFNNYGMRLSMMLRIIKSHTSSSIDRLIV